MPLILVRKKDHTLKERTVGQFVTSFSYWRIKPLDLACANLVLLSLVKSAVVLISINQSSTCEESFPLNIVVPRSKVFTKDVFLCALQKVSVYCCRTLLRGSGSADGQSVRVNLFSLHCRWLRASVGWVSFASTLCHK